MQSCRLFLALQGTFKGMQKVFKDTVILSNIFPFISVWRISRNIRDSFSLWWSLWRELRKCLLVWFWHITPWWFRSINIWCFCPVMQFEIEYFLQKPAEVIQAQGNGRAPLQWHPQHCAPHSGVSKASVEFTWSTYLIHLEWLISVLVQML